MGRLTHYKRVGLIGLPLAMLAFAGVALAPAALSIYAVAGLLFVAGNGLGTVLPITTVSVQNAVLPWQLGTVTGVINFVRALASALMVALYGAILFGGAGAGTHGITLEALAGHGTGTLAEHFRWVFAAAAVSLAFAVGLLVMMEERPLRSTTHATPVPAE
jgi:hypothetical protein